MTYPPQQPGPQQPGQPYQPPQPGQQTFLNNINPGNQVAGVLVYDIPKDAAIKSLELHDPAFSGGVTADVG